MKKIKFLSLGALALAGITIASCSGSNNIKSNKEVYGNNNDGNVAKISDCELLFKKGSDIPYISLDEGVYVLEEVSAPEGYEIKTKTQILWLRKFLIV